MDAGPERPEGGVPAVATGVNPEPSSAKRQVSLTGPKYQPKITRASPGGATTAECNWQIAEGSTAITRSRTASYAAEVNSVCGGLPPVATELHVPVARSRAKTPPKTLRTIIRRRSPSKATT